MTQNTTYRNPKEFVLAELTQRILTGVHPPNSFVPSQRQLAVEFNVNRGYVRQAMQALEAKGLVRTQHGRGTQVLPVNERRTHLRIAYVHSPAAQWLSPEGTLLTAGIMDRFMASGHPYVRVCCVEPTEPMPSAKAGHMVILSNKLETLVNQIDGMIFMEISSQKMAEQAVKLEQRQYPVVIANMELDMPVSGIRVDHRLVSLRAVEMLVGYGHSRIAFLGRDPSAYFYGESLEGYRQGLKAAGLPVDESLIAFAAETNGLHASVAARKFFALDQVPTAVIAARDVLAQGVCHAVEEAGLRVGYDVSVIGFDNVSWNEGQKFLTTFAEPCYEIGATAVNMLLDRLYNGWRPAERRVLEAPLVLRRSVGPVPVQPFQPRAMAVHTH